MPSKFQKKQLFDDSLIKDFGKDYVKILTIQLKKADKKASGALINSIDYRLQDEANYIKILIEANDYLEYVDQGRKPGSYPNITAISKWASMKGISQDAVFPIARKIFKFGIEPTNVIGKTVKEFDTSPKLQKKYEDILTQNIENIVFEEFKNINK